MKNTLYTIYLVILLLIPVVLIALPADFFDTGQSICFSIIFFNNECYACGMTRAIQHLIHFDFLIGYSYNKLSILVFPLLIMSYYSEVKRICNKI